jgi:hypothetical protein
MKRKARKKPYVYLAKSKETGIYQESEEIRLYLESEERGVPGE